MRTTILLLLAGLLGSPAEAATVTSLDDIRYWVGEGANRAALAIDWDGVATTDTALVWGYRWDGQATGAQMLLEVVANDPRLYARIGLDPEYGLGVWGLGYDLNDDGLFGLDDGTTFDSEGLALTSRSDGVFAIDPDDLYREGWARAYWHYGLGVTGEAGIAWATSGAGASQRVLVDGDWDSHAIARSLNYDEFAQNLIAAEPQLLPGDWNADGAIDAADYTLWSDAGGSQAEYTLWSSHYGTHSAGDTLASAITVPEPTAITCLFVFASSFFILRERPS